MEVFAATLWAFFASFLSIRLAKPIAYRTGLVDKPNERKHHQGAIPLVGGISIFIGVMTAMKIFIPNSTLINLYLLSSAIILLLGVLDDRNDLPVSYRMAVQSLSACIMIFGADLYLETLGGIFGFFEFSLGHLGILVTIVAVIGAINAFNMVDGIDGLAGMLSIVSFSGLVILFILGNSIFWVIPILFISAILAYLMFNLGWPSKRVNKIFMGDAGSMLIGLTIVWLLVLGSQGSTPAFRPVTALWIIALPLMDMAAIMIRRVRKGQSPFKPDRDHLHHICMRAGLSSNQSLFTITLISALIVIFGIIGEIASIPEWIMFLFFIFLFMAYSKAILNIWKVVTWIRSKRQI
ncbi:UDP-N-acetylglucosamine--undecaprenyl-phosphate N-acetylglucosaminephosphotransferase [Ferrimonas sp. SCSIO 43195]|uniref:UDP-N-acetylglucosamine--undecaprenyl-phosphate N-acetylglucosaminephosphotransferase n=1 Tax=Ferrimonas sp. SCSIO 43195 TaxID=2822844 RepID=UPI002075F40F|nr:UDP-N-acetylglucosamine--undecaprenyl-phosphate N-acetylglucosaminephosphotransferase [Ferrimonas sp. SCSIO 43195]USD38662.1 UDP-N-acetylglucosamine--undecaprenyl-phosphate N-acetylglucosaminephosphotransferase [Ferrimonas sp. SCSIO 43195]